MLTGSEPNSTRETSKQNMVSVLLSNHGHNRLCRRNSCRMRLPKRPCSGWAMFQLKHHARCISSLAALERIRTDRRLVLHQTSALHGHLHPAWFTSCSQPICIRESVPVLRTKRLTSMPNTGSGGSFLPHQKAVVKPQHHNDTLVLNLQRRQNKICETF